jgi:hypothetical protein
MHSRREASRITTIAVILAVLVIAPTATSAVIPPGGEAKIDVTVELRSREVHGGVSLIKEVIFNRRITKRPIGNVVSYCIGTDGVNRFCNWVYRFPLGSITAMGIVNSDVFHRVAIVGGTGFYSNIGGQVTAVALNDRIDRVVFNLEAF